MTTIIAFILILGPLITIHELGHFIAARYVGIRVERFSVGMPPRFITITSVDNGYLFRLFFFKRNLEGKIKWRPVFEKNLSWIKKIGSKTEYVIALLPLGGYVKMAGMIDENMDMELNNNDDEFMSKSLWAKILVLSAGVIMNTVLALVIFTLMGYYQGSPEVRNEPIISEVIEGMPAYNSGILSGDLITEIDGEKISTWDDLSSKIHKSPEKNISLIIKREDELLNYNLTTTINVIPSQDKIDTIGVIGIRPQVNFRNITINEALLLGLERTMASFGMIFQSLGLIGSGSASVSDLGGPIMIAQLAGQTFEAGIFPFLTFMALLSINLAFLNIMPIPGLDGGHILIHLIEGIIRKPISLKTRMIIQQAGMIFLLIIMVTVISNDFIRLFN